MAHWRKHWWSGSIAPIKPMSKTDFWYVAGKKFILSTNLNLDDFTRPEIIMIGRLYLALKKGEKQM